MIDRLGLNKVGSRYNKDNDVPKRVARRTRNINVILDEESEEEVAVEPEEPDLEIFHPSIESIHATRLLDGEKEYYVKLSPRKDG